MPNPLGRMELRGFRGLNDSANPFSLEPDEASVADNLRFDSGSVGSCLGTTSYGTASGTTVWCPGYDYVTRAGLRRHLRIATVNGNTALQRYNSGTWTTIGAGNEFQPALATFVTWPPLDAVFIAQKSGSSPVPKLIGTTLSTFGLPVPGVAPSLAVQNDGDVATNTLTYDGTQTAPDVDTVNGSGVLTAATYGVCYTYYNSSTGEESNPSEKVSAVIAAPDDTLRVEIQQDVWWTADTNFDTVRIYRTIADGADYYLDTEVDASDIKGGGELISDPLSTNRQVDIGLSSDVALASQSLLVEDNDRPPQLKYLVAHKSRLFGCGNSTNPNRLYYSTLEEPENWPEFNYFQLDVTPSGGKPELVGLLALQEQLYAFSRDQIFRLVGSSEADFRLERLPHGVGCISHHTICVRGTMAMWWSESGPIAWDGYSDPQPLASDKIGELLYWAHSREWSEGNPLAPEVALEPSRASEMSSALVSIGGRVQYWTTFTTRQDPAGTTHNRILVLDIASKSWSYRDIAAASIGIVEDDDDFERLYLGGYSGEVVEAERGLTRDGTAIESRWAGPWWYFDSADGIKKLRGFDIWLRPRDSSEAAHDVMLSWYFDHSDVAAGTMLVPVDSSRSGPVEIAASGKFQSMRLEVTSSGGWALDRLIVWFRQEPILREKSS